MAGVEEEDDGDEEVLGDPKAVLGWVVVPARDDVGEDDGEDDSVDDTHQKRHPVEIHDYCGEEWVVVDTVVVLLDRVVADAVASYHGAACSMETLRIYQLLQTIMAMAFSRLPLLPQAPYQRLVASWQ